MNGYNHQLGILGGAAIVLLAMQPLQAANTQINQIETNSRKNTLELTLKTVGKQKQTAKISTIKRHKTVVTKLENTQLNLKKSQSFLQKNPAPNIATVKVNQDQNNNLTIAVTGKNKAPTGQIFLQQADKIILSFTVSRVPTQSKQIAKQKSPSLLAQTSDNPSAPERPLKPDVLVPNPQISIDGQPVTNGNYSTPAPTPAFLPRAVAPPVGDMAVSNIDSSAITLDLGSNVPIQRLVLKDAPVREVLALLARSANLNLVYTGSEADQEQALTTISLDIRNQPIQEVFNSVLLVSGLQANLRGSTIFVGGNLPQQARNLLTRTFRLNQISAADAAGFLAAHGAEAQRIVTKTTTTIQEGQAGLRQTFSESTTEIQPITAEEQEGPLLLRGASVTTDERLNTITVVAEPRQMQIVTSMLMQMDARRRQVAINVKIVDVNLLNSEQFNASLSFGIGDGFFVSDNGAAAFSYTDVTPPSANSLTDGTFAPPVTRFPLPDGATGAPFFDPQDGPFSNTNQAIGVPYARPNFGTFSNPYQPGVSDVADDGRIEFELPGLFQYPTKFLALLEAKIDSGNGKILTDPTLVVQEGQSAQVKLVEEVFGGFKRQQITLPDGSSSTVDEPIIKNAGLTLDINVDRIDDNGFVSVNVNPIISAIAGSQFTEQGEITLTQERSLKSGTIRLRDNQTLILSGIIQEIDRTTVRKVPVLGDIPILGALFRSTSRTNERNEVVVLLTPQIIADNQTSGWGYNYTPGKDAADMLRRQGFPVPGPRQ